MRLAESDNLKPSKEEIDDLKWKIRHTIDDIADYEDNGLQIRLSSNPKGIKVTYRVIDGLNYHEQHAYVKIFPTADDVDDFIETMSDKDLDRETFYEIVDELGFKEVD